MYSKLILGVTTYNNAKFLEDFLSSFIHKHQYPNDKLDIIIVDDASPTEYAHDIANRIINNKYHYKIITHRENQGYGAAKNTLFNECKKYQADYWVICDDDIVWRVENALVYLSQTADAFPEFGVIGTHLSLLANGYAQPHHQTIRTYRNDKSGHMIHEMNLVPGNSFLVRPEVIDLVGPMLLTLPNNKSIKSSAGIDTNWMDRVVATNKYKIGRLPIVVTYHQGTSRM